MRRWRTTEPTFCDQLRALHESGHVVAAHVLGHLVVDVTIIPNEELDHGGCANIEYDVCPHRKLDKLVVWMAGHHAARARDPELDQAGAADDVEKAARLAQELGGAGDGMTAVWDRAHELTFAFLRIEEHWSAIVAVADELLRRRTLEHPEIQEIVEQHLGSRPAGSVSAARTAWDEYLRTGWSPVRRPSQGEV